MDCSVRRDVRHDRAPCDGRHEPRRTNAAKHHGAQEPLLRRSRMRDSSVAPSFSFRRLRVDSCNRGDDRRGFCLRTKCADGYTGLASAGHAMFYGLGGYGIAIGTAICGWPLWVTVPATLVCIALISTAVGAICTRTRGVEFLLITLAFSQMFFGAAVKLRLTNGADGMAGIPRPDLSSLGVSADDPVVFYYYVAC